MSITIRLAAEDDGEAVAAIVESAFSPWVAVLGRRPAPMDDDYPRRINAGEVHVATRDGAVIGMLRVRAERQTLWLETVAVAPDHQRSGVGRRLIAHAETIGRGRGFERMRLYTNAAMAANLSLYPALGYTQTGQERQAGFDRVFFAKQLGGRA